MNLRGIDLNLLVVLDALLEEAHVSRAAERLGLSQPAASSALDRCRALFRDPLLERGRGLMRLTPKAEALKAPLKAWLSDAEAILDPPTPELASLEQTVRLVMADMPAAFVAGPLHMALRSSAPRLNLVVQPWHGAAAALEGLARGGSDLAVSVFPDVDAAFRREELSRERYAVVMRRGHPAAEGFELESWLAWPHLLVSGRGETNSPLDRQLARMGKARRVGLVVPSFLMVLPLVRGSELIAMLPERCLPEEERDAFQIFPPPIPVEGFPLHLAWHMRRDRDPAVRHVAGLLRQHLAA